jgi:hypothetical protein
MAALSDLGSFHREQLFPMASPHGVWKYFGLLACGGGLAGGGAGAEFAVEVQ